METKYLSINYEKDSVDIPYIEIIVEKPGPHLFISWWIHGNEIWGIVVIEAFIIWLKKSNITKDLAWKITILPLLNPSGFNSMKRRVAEDNKDLNRCFGLKKRTSFSEEIAYQLEEHIFSKTDYWIDFHDAWWRSILMPHSRVHKNEEWDYTKKMWQVFGTKLIIERKWKDNMMAFALWKKYWTRVLTLELWWAQRIFDDYVNIGIKGIRNFLSYAYMYPWEIILPEKQYILKKRFWVSLKDSAVILFQIKVWDFVHYGDYIWDVYYPKDQKNEILTSPMCWYIFSLWSKNQVPFKAPKKTHVIYSILEWEECHIENAITNKIEKLENIHIDEVVM